MTVFAAVKLSPSPPARVDNTIKRDQATSRAEQRSERTEDGDFGIVGIFVDHRLSVRHVRLSGELEVLDAHRVEHDFENLEDLCELREEQYSISASLHLREHAFEGDDLARFHPFLVLETILLEILRMENCQSSICQGNEVDSPCSAHRIDAAQNPSSPPYPRR